MISRYASGKSEPSFDTIIKIARFANISLDWLAFGRGNKYNKDNISLVSDYKEIKVYDISVSAGAGCFVDDEFVNSTIVLPRKFLDIYGLSGNYVGTAALTAQETTVRGTSGKKSVIFSHIFCTSHFFAYLCTAKVPL